ncbi:GFA family protein [Aspergillus foveolatus]|uniref:GFA family protein n=1 Tax=Aspergillus foveolatus TaxID=210207 RepID=UPI003CCDA129
MPLSGHCLCQAVTYTANAKPDTVAYCHCDDCQRQSGSTYSLYVMVSPDQLSVDGPLKTFQRTGSSGSPVLQKFCQICGCPLFIQALSAENELAIMGGSLDCVHKLLLQPSIEIWTASKLPFCQERLRSSHAKDAE